MTKPLKMVGFLKMFESMRLCKMRRQAAND